VHERGPEDDRAAVSLADSPNETDPLVKGGLHATCEPRASPIKNEMTLHSPSEQRLRCYLAAPPFRQVCAGGERFRPSQLSHQGAAALAFRSRHERS
jgi:hypothetical protein